MDQNSSQPNNVPEEPKVEVPRALPPQPQEPPVLPTPPAGFAQDPAAAQTTMPIDIQGTTYSPPRQAPAQPQSTVYSPYPAQPQPTQEGAATQPSQPPQGYRAPQQPVQSQAYQPQQPPQSYQPQPPQPQAYQPQQAQQPYPQQYAPPVGNVPPTQPVYPPVNAGAQVAQPPKKQGGVPVWVWIIGAMLALLVLACGVISFVAVNALRTTAQQTGKIFSTIGSELGSDLSTMSMINATAFYSDLSGGQYEDARQYMTTQMQSQYSADKLRADWEKLTAGDNTISPIPNLSQINTKQAKDQTLVETLQGSNGKSYTVKLKMKNVNDEWLIDGADPAIIPQP